MWGCGVGEGGGVRLLCGAVVLGRVVVWGLGVGDGGGVGEGGGVGLGCRGRLFTIHGHIRFPLSCDLILPENLLSDI